MPAEYSIPVAGDDVVKAVQQRGRKHAEQASRLPGPSEHAGDKERCAALCEDPGLGRSIVRPNVKRCQLVTVAAGTLHYRSARGTLERREIEDTPTITYQNELQESATKSADAVVQNKMRSLGVGSDLRFRIEHALITVNVFTTNVKPRGRGRPPGPTPRGAATRQRLYAVAIKLIANQGYESTTLRDVAKEAGVSVGLLYRYFPSKRAVIIALYEELSAEYARQALEGPRGRWRDRFIFALQTSLQVLEPHRIPLQALIPVLVGDPEEGVFARSAAFSRVRVQRVFEEAVVGSTDAPAHALAEAVGRLLYLVHLAVLLWWLLDKSPKQRATTALVLLTQQILPSTALTLRLPPVRRFVISADELVRGALFDDEPVER